VEVLMSKYGEPWRLEGLRTGPTTVIGDDDGPCCEKGWPVANITKSKRTVAVVPAIPSDGLGGDPVPHSEEAVAARIVACVNALSGRDPDKLADLEAACEEPPDSEMFSMIDAFMEAKADGDYARHLRDQLAAWNHNLRAKLAAFRSPS
jgi:hypothetical protein